jgi:hypothetical protein
VALRQQDKSLSRLSSVPDGNGGTFDPNIRWNDGSPWKKRLYQAEILPDHYVCPFTRGKEYKEAYSGSSTIGGVEFAHSYFEGRRESYQTWKWEGGTVRGLLLGSMPDYPGDPCERLEPCMRDGRPKYSVFSWSRVRPDKDIKKANQYMIRTSVWYKNWTSMNLHRLWTSKDAHRVKAGSVSEVTTVFCAQGKHMVRGSHYDLPGGGKGPKIVNPNSHRRNQGGGTNTIFADSHVEWVKGTQIGWW